VKNQVFDFTTDLRQALLWQHNNAPVLQSLIASKQAWYDANHTAFWSDWFTDVFDLRTCNLFGMCVWAIILGVPLPIILDPEYTKKRIFGFAPFSMNFYSSNFGSIAETVAPLTLEEQRLILQLRYFQLISRGTVLTINRFLLRIFGALGVSYVVDNHDMTMTYFFKFDMSGGLRYALSAYDLLPRPASVAVTIITGA
jgi:Protein of unknown function (DUF2612)